MQFTSKTGAAAGRKSAEKRWGDKPPATVRKNQIKVWVSDEEECIFSGKAAAAGVSKNELIIRAVKEYQIKDTKG